MGGPGSGGSRTWNPRPRVEDSLSLHVGTLGRDLARPGRWRWVGWSRRGGEPDARISVYVAEGAVQLVYTVTLRGGEARDITDDVGVEWTACPYGGRRPWWLCPGCGRRAGVLHCWGGRFRCRLCHGLAYMSQVEKPMERAIRAARRARRAAGMDDGGYAFEAGPRPRGMHAATYSRLLDKLDDCLSVWAGGLRARVGALEAQSEQRQQARPSR